MTTLQGTGMVGVPGIASRIFSTVRDAGINVIMISQASSEQSICFAVKGTDGCKAVSVLEARFKESIAAGRVSAVQRIDNCCVLAAVGQGMVNRKGVAATMMGALAKANVNIKAIAQGSSEYNITVLLDQKDSERALRAVHSRFYLSNTPIGIGLVGPGLIGSALLTQIKEQCDQLRKEFNIDLRVLGIASSKKMLLSETGINLDNWKEDFETKVGAGHRPSRAWDGGRPGGLQGKKFFGCVWAAMFSMSPGWMVHLACWSHCMLLLISALLRSVNAEIVAPLGSLCNLAMFSASQHLCTVAVFFCFKQHG